MPGDRPASLCENLLEDVVAIVIVLDGVVPDELIRDDVG